MYSSASVSNYTDSDNAIARRFCGHCSLLWAFSCNVLLHVGAMLHFAARLPATRVSRYQKGKTNQDFTEARDSEWQWHQLGRMHVCTSLQTDNHASTPPQFFTGQMPFLSPNQRRQSTEGKACTTTQGLFSSLRLNLR